MLVFINNFTGAAEEGGGTSFLLRDHTLKWLSYLRPWRTIVDVLKI